MCKGDLSVLIRYRSGRGRQADCYEGTRSPNGIRIFVSMEAISRGSAGIAGSRLVTLVSSISSPSGIALVLRSCDSVKAAMWRHLVSSAVASMPSRHQFWNG
jgi:hypothetical protein